MSDVEFHTMPADAAGNTRRIAYRFAAGRGPALVFLPGYMSDMDGGKATSVFEWAKARGQACLLLDYSGCGLSDGDFADGSLSQWREEACALIEAKIDGAVVVIGSSMGGWLNLLVGLSLGDRLAGLVGIASAPDFSDWGFDGEQKAALKAGETIYEESDYGYDPMPTHAKFWRDAEQLRLLDGRIDITCPVRLIHGQNDADVPWEISVKLADALASEDVVMTLIKDGDHRLSREQDIARLLSTIGEIA